MKIKQYIIYKKFTFKIMNHYKLKKNARTESSV